MMKKARQKVKRHKKTGLPRGLERVNLDAAGIDVGACEHYVAVPPERDPQPIRKFGSFTEDLHALADWLQQCGVTTVAMESTGVYWLPLFQILERRGFEVKLVNARQIKNAPGRKTDVVDCEWIRTLHMYGLLTASFVPPDQIRVLRSYLRQREDLIRQASMQIQLMQKALDQMNLHLHHVISDVAGVTGLRIVQAIVAGERDPDKLASLKDPRIVSSQQTIVKALQGDYRSEHLFCLAQALDCYKFFRAKIAECDQQVQALLQTFESKADISENPPAPRERTRRSRDNEPTYDLYGELYRITGLNLCAVPGLNVSTLHQIIAEVGIDMSPWKTEKHFSSWAGLSPNTRISGGKRLKSRPRQKASRVAHYFRLAASTLKNSRSAYGAFFRRMKARHGGAYAITATAHKLASIFYRMLRYGIAYVEEGQQRYEQRYREHQLRRLRMRATQLGFQLLEKQPFTAGVS